MIGRENLHHPLNPLDIPFKPVAHWFLAFPAYLFLLSCSLLPLAKFPLLQISRWVVLIWLKRAAKWWSFLTYWKCNNVLKVKYYLSSWDFRKISYEYFIRSHEFQPKKQLPTAHLPKMSWKSAALLLVDTKVIEETQNNFVCKLIMRRLHVWIKYAKASHTVFIHVNLVFV